MPHPHWPILFLLGAAVPLAAQDLAADVHKACTSPRLGLRLAAARKVAAAGDAAVPAIAAFLQAEGQDHLPVSLVEAIADKGGDGDATVGLLATWAADRDFYWRGQALRGLALRAPRLPQRRAQLLPLFDRLATDPAWLTRVFARLGRELLRPLADVGDEPPAETDPRAISKLAALRLDLGQTPPLQPLFDALLDQRSCLGDPWGRRRGLEAFKALQGWLGGSSDFQLDAAPAANRPALEELLQQAAAKSGQKLQLPEPLRDQELAIAGGIEVFSCRNGDLFARWTASGTVLLGLLGEHRVVLPQASWQPLATAAAQLQPAAEAGVVICDRLRLVLEQPARQGVVAPAAMPAEMADWLKHLAAAIEEAGDAAAAATLRDRLAQFAAR